MPKRALGTGGYPNQGEYSPGKDPDPAGVEDTRLQLKLSPRGTGKRGSPQVNEDFGRLLVVYENRELLNVTPCQ